jgi:hypothetical protein
VVGGGAWVDARLLVEDGVVGAAQAARAAVSNKNTISLRIIVEFSFGMSARALIEVNRRATMTLAKRGLIAGVCIERIGRQLDPLTSSFATYSAISSGTLDIVPPVPANAAEW